MPCDEAFESASMSNQTPVPPLTLFNTCLFLRVQNEHGMSAYIIDFLLVWTELLSTDSMAEDGKQPGRAAWFDLIHIHMQTTREVSLPGRMPTSKVTSCSVLRALGRKLSQLIF